MLSRLTSYMALRHLRTYLHGDHPVFLRGFHDLALSRLRPRHKLLLTQETIGALGRYPQLNACALTLLVALDPQWTLTFAYLRIQAEKILSPLISAPYLGPAQSLYLCLLGCPALLRRPGAPGQVWAQLQNIDLDLDPLLLLAAAPGMIVEILSAQPSFSRFQQLLLSQQLSLSQQPPRWHLAVAFSKPDFLVNNQISQGVHLAPFAPRDHSLQERLFAAHPAYALGMYAQPRLSIIHRGVHGSELDELTVHWNPEPIARWPDALLALALRHLPPSLEESFLEASINRIGTMSNQARASVLANCPPHVRAYIFSTLRAPLG